MNQGQYAPPPNGNQGQYAPPPNGNQGQYAPPQNMNQGQYAPPQNANQGQYAPPPGTQMVQIAGPVDSNHRPNYMGKAAIGLGIAHIVIGVAIIVTQIITNLAQTPLSPGGTGYWMGIFFIVTGVFGLLSGKSKKKNMIIVFLVLSIVSTVFASSLVILSGISVLIGSLTGGGCYSGTCYKDIDGFAAEGALSVLAAIELIVAIISSGFGCGGLCCFRQRQANQVVYTQDGQVLVIQNGQGAAGGYQPQMVPAAGYQPQMGTSTGYQPQGPPQYDFQEKKTGGIP